MTIIIVTMMKPRQPYKLIYDPEVARHLARIERKYYSFIRHTIEEQLSYEPETETRNRKPLIRSAKLDASRELRFGPDNRFRVFYQTDQPSRKVYILAIGVKEGNRLFIGREELEL